MDSGLPGGGGREHGPQRLPLTEMRDGNGRWVLGGGIGSGKSAVRRLLEESGVRTIDADSVGHRVLEPDGAAFGEVADRFPTAVVDGRIDRKKLAATVFEENVELDALEAITHPHIFDTIRGHIQEIDGPVVVEMPVINHSLGPEWRLMVVDSPEEVRVERAIARGMSVEDVRARVKSQPSRREWLARADLVIPNAGTLTELAVTVAEVAHRL